MKKTISKFMAGTLMCGIICSNIIPFNVSAAVYDTIDVDIRVFDESTGRIIEDVANVTVPAKDGSDYIQSELYRVPKLDTLTETEFGRVTKVMGNYYFPVGQVSEGSGTYWSTNNNNGTLTYYVTSWQPGTGSGSGSNGTTDGTIGTSGKKTWTQKVIYHSNYPDGTDYTQTYTYTVKSYTTIYSTYEVLSLEELGFSLPDGYEQDSPKWNKAADGSGKDVSNLLTLSQSEPEIHIYAQWVPVNSVVKDPVTLTHKDGDSIYAENEYFAGDTAVTVTCDTDKGNLEFQGWDTDISADSVIYPAGNSFTINEDQTVYAVWTEKAAEDTIILTYDANGGTGAPSADDSGVTEGENATFTISSTIPTHPNDNKFLGWADSPDATTPDYQADDTLTTTTDKTIYAVWEKTEEETPSDKISKPGIDKKSDGQDSIADVTPGDTVNFTLDSHIGTDLLTSVTNTTGSYTGTYTLTFYDTLTGPITFNPDSVTVSVGGTKLDSSDFVLNTNPSDGKTFTVSLDVVALLNNGKFNLTDAGKAEKSAVQVAYTATVNEDANDQDSIKNDAYVNDSATDTVTGEVVDKPTPPETGSQIALACSIGGAVLMGGSAIFFVKKKKHQ